MTTDRIGFLAGLSAYSLWGLYPFYFKALDHVTSIEVLAHRIVWSLVMLALFLPLPEMRRDVARVFRTPRLLLGMLFSALIIASNWLVYVIAVQTGHVLEASLGYFLSPLTFVLLALVVLRERLRRLQWLAVGIAVFGVLWMIIYAGVVPKIALFLGISFSIYGLVRKRLPVGPLAGLFLECLFALPLAGAMFLYAEATGGIVFTRLDLSTNLLVMLAGFFTIGPLWLFNVAAKHLPLTTLGMLQYIAPTLLFFVGAFVFSEPVDVGRLLGFVLIWAALAIYSLDALRTARPAPAA
ncbi:MAG TPA: EamA family transporter RarD [Geminicoccus sp.]|uniref:EamA family transporter RarD n=1 Tax=Geminicoccus sp. TaxID=2024832 RepID=UPI002B7362F6|nr:EamA family transporter RarD [Geminicoccus sp.]HWL70205.1 EamA family transporter RarD [Geminicoccus sp.]